MTVHFQREIDRIKQQILSLSAIVEEQLRMSVQVLLDRDDETAQAVREGE